MKNDEAMKIIEPIYDALFQSKVALQHSNDGWIRAKQMEEKIKEKEQYIIKALKDYSETKLLLNAFIREFGDVFEVCPECNGCGGFEFQNPDGSGGGETCHKCLTKGVLRKDKVEDMFLGANKKC